MNSHSFLKEKLNVNSVRYRTQMKNNSNHINAYKTIFFFRHQQAKKSKKNTLIAFLDMNGNQCNLCSYKTVDFSRFVKHLQTKKHKNEMRIKQIDHEATKDS